MRSLGALATFPDAELCLRTFDLALTRGAEPERVRRTSARCWPTRSACQAVWTRITERWDAIFERFPKNAPVRILESLPALCGGPDVRRVRRRLPGRPPAGVGPASVAQSIERLGVNVAFAARERGGLGRVLAPRPPSVSRPCRAAPRRLRARRRPLRGGAADPRLHARRRGRGAVRGRAAGRAGRHPGRRAGDVRRDRCLVRQVDASISARRPRRPAPSSSRSTTTGAPRRTSPAGSTTRPTWSTRTRDASTRCCTGGAPSRRPGSSPRWWASSATPPPSPRAGTGPLAFCFIDGGHGDEPAWADYRGWSPHVAVGGWLAIHDVFPDPADGGRPPYELCCAALESGEFVEDGECGSLRVLRRVARAAPVTPAVTTRLDRSRRRRYQPNSRIRSSQMTK